MQKVNLRLPTKLIEDFNDLVGVESHDDIKVRNRAIAILMKMAIDDDIDIDWDKEDKVGFDGLSLSKSKKLGKAKKLNFRIPYDLMNDFEFKLVTQQLDFNDVVKKVCQDWAEGKFELVDIGHYFSIGEKTKTSKVSKSIYLSPTLHKKFVYKVAMLRRTYTVYVSEGSAVVMLIDMIMTNKVMV